MPTDGANLPPITCHHVQRYAVLPPATARRVFRNYGSFASVLLAALMVVGGEMARAQDPCNFTYNNTCYPDLASAESAMRTGEWNYFLTLKQVDGNRRTYHLPPKPPLPNPAWKAWMPNGDYVWGFREYGSPHFHTAQDALTWAQVAAAKPTHYSPQYIVSDDLVYRGSYDKDVGSATYEHQIYTHNYTAVPVTTIEMPVSGGVHFFGWANYFAFGIQDAKVSDTFHTVYRHENTPEPTVYHVKGAGHTHNGQNYKIDALPVVFVREVDSGGCPSPYTFDGTQCTSNHEPEILDWTQGPFHSLAEPEQQSPTCPNDTNPCNPADGNKSQTENDYAGSASGGLRFTRYYNSKGSYKTGKAMAAGWRHSYSRSLDEEPDRKPTLKFAAPVSHQSAFYQTPAQACTSGWGDIKDAVWAGSLSTATATFAGGSHCRLTSGSTTVAYFPIRSVTGWTGQSPSATVKSVSRPDGASYKFELDGSVWVNTLNPALKLEQSGSNWVFTDAEDTKETYNAAGQLVSISYRNGQAETLEYDLTVSQGGDDDSSTLDKVTGPFGHSISFSYNSNGHLDSVTTPDGAIQYAYDVDENLTTVTYPDSTTRQYLFEDTDLPNHLTGLIDENSARFATWDYDVSGRAVSSEHAGGKERVQLAYNSDGTTTLTLANGAVRTYTFGNEQGERRLTSLSGDVCGDCSGGDIKSREYDGNGFLSETTDWNNNVTKMTRNGRGLVETLTEAFGLTDERETATVWHSTFRLPTKVTSPRNVTDYTHDANGNILTAIISGGGKTRGWTFTYNTSGQPLTINGPRTDVTDITTLEYYTCTTGGECGQLKKVTNALGHMTTYDTYDSAGRLTKMTDPNGLATAYTYDLRGRPLTITEISDIRDGPGHDDDL